MLGPLRNEPTAFEILTLKFVMKTITRIDLGYFALAFGTLLLCLSIVQAGDPWPTDPNGVLFNNKTCVVQAGPPGANGNCTYPAGTCYAVTIDPAIDAMTAADYFKIIQSRSWGYCSAGYSSAGDQCTKYPSFTCAQIHFFETRNDAGVCQNLYSGAWITIGADICNPAATIGGGDPE